MKSKKVLLTILVVMLAVISMVAFVACEEAVDKIKVEKPKDIKYDSTYITWTGGKADHYLVSINGGQAVKTNGTIFAYDAQNEQFEVTITSVVGEATETESKTFTPLPQLDRQNISIESNGTVSWSLCKVQQPTKLA